MIDLTDFKKYKRIYFLIISVFTFLLVLRNAPSYRGIFVDVIVEPPENTRKTDFSWITVNEWFLTQVHMIKSDAILEGVKSDIGRDRIKRIVSVKRLGASNIIRISASSGDDPEKLKGLVSGIADLYLSQINKLGVPAVEQEKIAEQPQRESPVQEAEREKTLDALRKDRRKIEKEMNAAEKRRENYETGLNHLGPETNRLQEAKARVGEIDRQLIPLNRELAKLRPIYTDNWPSVSNLLIQIKMLESERQKFNTDLSVLQKVEDKRADISSKIDKEEKTTEALKNELKEINGRLARVPAEQKKPAEKPALQQKKEELTGRIISPPAENRQIIYFKLGAMVVITIILAPIIWFLIGRLLKNIYLFWIFKDRLFRKR